ncbi:MAG: hypothetical protein ACRDP8_11005 [Actinopolymorphaceae bacterium]
MEWGLLYAIAMHDQTRPEVQRMSRALRLPWSKAINDAVARLTRATTSRRGLHARRPEHAIRT